MYTYIWSLCSILFVGILADSVHSFAAKNGMLFCFYCSFKFQFADMSVCVYQRFSCVCASGGIIVGSDKYVNILAQLLLLLTVWVIQILRHSMRQFLLGMCPPQL